MNGKINLYGRARRLALVRYIVVIICCIVATVLLLKYIFADTNTNKVVGEYDKLSKFFLSRGYVCEALETDGGKCVLSTDIVKTTFYRYDSGFEYSSKTDSYNLYISHRLDKEDKIEFTTSSEAFSGYKNQSFICSFENNVLSGLEECISEKDDIKLDVNSYIGVIEQAQADIASAVNYSGFSLDNLTINYEWTKK